MSKPNPLVAGSWLGLTFATSTVITVTLIWALGELVRKLGARPIVIGVLLVGTLTGFVYGLIAWKQEAQKAKEANIESAVRSFRYQARLLDGTVSDFRRELRLLQQEVERDAE